MLRPILIISFWEILSSMITSALLSFRGSFYRLRICKQTSRLQCLDQIASPYHALVSHSQTVARLLLDGTVDARHHW
jgi:hypothetical protein